MNKVFYWSPYLSNVATIKNVINSAFSLVRYGGHLYNATILDSIGEWSKKKQEILKKKINYIKINKLDLSIFFPIDGYLKSRFFSVLIFIVSFFSLRKILLCERPKYLIIHLVSSVPLILLFFFNFETNFILRISGLPKLNFIRKFIWKYSGKKLFLITCPSLETKNYLLKLNIFPENKIVVLLDPILNLSEIITKKKENIDVPHNRKYFLSIGRLTRQKNHMLLIKLFATIFKNSSNFFLYIIGDGEDKLKLIKKIKELKLEDRIFLLGYKNNIFPYLYNAKALLSSSLWEDPGAVMIEAAFCNVTIISSDCVSGPKEFIENNKAGYIFRNNNFQSLLSVFQKFLEENNKNIFFKKINAKKKTIKFTVFRHYQQLNYFLS